MRESHCFNVEIFYKGEFRRWFPCSSINELYETIARLDAKRLGDLELSYLVFREGARGSFELYKGGKRYYLASRINCTGKEKPEFMQHI